MVTNPIKSTDSQVLRKKVRAFTCALVQELRHPKCRCSCTHTRSRTAIGRLEFWWQAPGWSHPNASGGVLSPKASTPSLYRYLPEPYPSPGQLPAPPKGNVPDSIRFGPECSTLPKLNQKEILRFRGQSITLHP